jgi:hypothetical protein
LCRSGSPALVCSVENAKKPPAEVRQAAQTFFQPDRHMVRPVDPFGVIRCVGPLRTTAQASALAAVAGPSALLVCVRIDQNVHAVLMLAFSHSDSVAASMDFLSNDGQGLPVSNGALVLEKGHWEVESTATIAVRPKGDDSFQFN